MKKTDLSTEKEAERQSAMLSMSRWKKALGDWKKEMDEASNLYEKLAGLMLKIRETQESSLWGQASALAEVSARELGEAITFANSAMAAAKQYDEENHDDAFRLVHEHRKKSDDAMAKIVEIIKQSKISFEKGHRHGR